MEAVSNRGARTKKRLGDADNAALGNDRRARAREGDHRESRQDWARECADVSRDVADEGYVCDQGKPGDNWTTG